MFSTPSSYSCIMKQVSQVQKWSTISLLRRGLVDLVQAKIIFTLLCTRIYLLRMCVCIYNMLFSLNGNFFPAVVVGMNFFWYKYACRINFSKSSPTPWKVTRSTLKLTTARLIESRLTLVQDYKLSKVLISLAQKCFHCTNLVEFDIKQHQRGGQKIWTENLAEKL